MCAKFESWNKKCDLEVQKKLDLGRFIFEIGWNRVHIFQGSCWVGMLPCRVYEIIHLHILCKLDLTLWNLSCLEFKFDDTRLSYWHKNKIGRIEKKMLLPDFANFLPCWPAQFCWDSQQGRELAKSWSNKKNSNSANLILMSIRKSGIIRFEFQTT